MLYYWNSFKVDVGLGSQTMESINKTIPLPKPNKRYCVNVI